MRSAEGGAAAWVWAAAGAAAGRALRPLSVKCRVFISCPALERKRSSLVNSSREHSSSHYTPPSSPSSHPHEHTLDLPHLSTLVTLHKYFLCD